MKAVFYISSLYGGGAERVLVNLMNFLADRGEEVELILNQQSGPYLSLLSQSITIHELDAKLIKHSIFELAAYLNRLNPDLTMSTLDDCNYALALAGKFSKANPTIVVREPNSFLTKTKSLPTFRKFYERLKARLFYPLADIIFVNSKGSRKELSRITGISESKIKILPNPLEQDKIKRKANEALPEKIADFLSNRSYIVAVGRLEEAKGFDILLKAFNQLSRKDYRLIILGEGGRREELKGIINQFDLRDRVYMPGYVNNPYSVMNNADLFVLSSRYEGMPNVLLESMTLGVPIVATDCPNGPRELLKRGKYGTLVPVESVAELAKAIENQIGKDILNKEDQKKYIRQFDVEQVGSTFYSYLKELHNSKL